MAFVVMRNIRTAGNNCSNSADLRVSSFHSYSGHDTNLREDRH